MSLRQGSGFVVRLRRELSRTLSRTGMPLRCDCSRPLLLHFAIFIFQFAFLLPVFVRRLAGYARQAATRLCYRYAGQAANCSYYLFPLLALPSLCALGVPSTSLRLARTRRRGLRRGLGYAQRGTPRAQRDRPFGGAQGRLWGSISSPAPSALSWWIEPYLRRGRGPGC